MTNREDDCDLLGNVEGFKHKPISPTSVFLRRSDASLILRQDDDFIIMDRQQAALLAPLVSAFLKKTEGR